MELSLYRYLLILNNLEIMEKGVGFCKSYLAGALFAFVALLCIALAVYGAICLDGLLSCTVIFLAVIGQAVSGSLIQQYENVPVRAVSWIVEWYGLFLALAVALIVCAIITQPTSMLILYIPLTIIFVVFVAVFSHLLSIAHVFGVD